VHSYLTSLRTVTLHHCAQLHYIIAHSYITSLRTVTLHHCAQFHVCRTTFATMRIFRFNLHARIQVGRVLPYILVLFLVFITLSLRSPSSSSRDYKELLESHPSRHKHVTNMVATASSSKQTTVATQTYLPQISPNQTIVTDRPTQRTALNYVFNESCPQNVLGLPDYVAESCSRFPPSHPCHHLTCRNLINGYYPDMYSTAREFMKLHPRNASSDEQFVTMTNDCELFRKTRGFDKKLTMNEEQDFPIAFNVIVHKDVEQVHSLQCNCS